MFTPKEEDLFSEAPREPSVASGISTVSSRLARCRAKAEAAKVRLSYAEKEAEIHQKQAALAAEAKLLQERKNVAAIEAEVEVLTKSMELEPFSMLNIPSLSAKQKTEQYVDFCNNGVKDRPTETKEEVPSNVKRSLRPEAPEFLPPSSKQNDIVQSMFKRDLLLSRLNKFDDIPEYYMVWKATFQSVLDELRVSPREVVDLLLKYLGPNSSRQALIIHSSNPNFPERSLSRIWDRLEERFSAPEIICSSVTRKIENFPKIIKDVERLYDLADIVSEVEGLKEDPKFTSLLSSYDSSTGINVFINKMPYSVQDKWTNAAQTYKRQHHVAYPPFEFFANFVRVQAKERNDPSFMYEPRESRQKSNPKISVKKTEFNVKEPEGKSVSSNSSPMNCLIHKLPHSLNKCNAFKRMCLRERKHMLFVNKVCFKCCESTDHKAEMCNAKVKCGICNVNSHPTALHDYRSQTVSEHSGEKTKTDKEDSDKNCEIKTDNTRIETKCTEVNQNCEFKGKSCAKAVLVRIYKKDNPEHALISYALIDDQSNKSLAKSELFEYFGECGREIEYTMSSCAGDSVHSGRISEGFVVESVLDGKKVELTSLIECNEIPNNWNEIPTPEVCKKFAHLGDLAQLIPPVDRSKHVVVLIGRDAPTAHHVLEQIVGGDQEPFAQKLKLGWVIVGEVCQGALHSSFTINVNKTYILRNDRPSHFKGCNMMLDCKFQTKEALGSSVFERTNNDNKIGQSIEDKRFIEIMNSDFEKNEKGNWSVPLPFRVNCPHRPLPSNYEIARKRAFLLCKSLKKDPEKCEDFCEFMSKMIGNGHAEIAPALHEGEEHWYLPIFGVYHPKKERKIRVVFDSSSKFKGVSLNDVLLSGPDLTNSLLGVLLRFRKYKVAIAADIKQMFFCFYVKPEHRNFLRFMWFRDNDPQKEIIEYRMCVHVFGNSPSPAIATYGLHKTILEGKEEFGEDTCDYVMNNFYVDDGLLSAPSVEMAVNILKRTQNSLKKGGNLILHKIASNKSEVMEAFQQDELASDLKNIHIGEEELPIQRSLGVCWDLVTDTFTFSTTSERKPFTRRGLLSVVNGLYDPLGIAAPIIIQGKIFLRHWISGNDWDEPLPDAFFPVWEKWKSSLK